MTREEAINNREKCLEYLEGIGSMAIPTCVEAVRWSLKALRAYPAKLDRSQWEGCGFCTDELDDYPYIKASNEYIDSDREHIPQYCPICGKPLTEEAWAELEKRIGGSDGKADS